MHDNNSLGQRVKLIRKQNRMTQSSFSQILDISQGYLSEIETGKSKPTLDVLVSIALSYRVDLNWLIFNEEMYNRRILKNDEEKLVDSYRQLNDIDKEEIFDFIELKLKRFKKWL